MDHLSPELLDVLGSAYWCADNLQTLFSGWPVGASPPDFLAQFQQTIWLIMRTWTPWLELSDVDVDVASLLENCADNVVTSPGVTMGTDDISIVEISMRTLNSLPAKGPALHPVHGGGPDKTEQA